MKSCEIVLGDYTDFHWDTLCVFPESASQVEIEKVLGKSLADYEEMSVHEVFLERGVVVRHEQAFPDPEAPPRDGLVFDFPRGVEFLRYMPRTELRAAVKTHAGYRYFVLGSK